MSNTAQVEPTEEQKQAAKKATEKVLGNAECCRPAYRVARLLAEREAKLREEVARLEALCTEEARLIVERDTLRARVAELESLLQRWVSSYVGGRHGEDARSLVDVTYKALTGAPLAHYDDAKADADAVDMQAWANGSCPEPGCSLANPHEQGAACVKPTDAEGGEG